ncbi:MAG: helix-turn-helix domain-containing protein [Pseudomonadota bacterium]
MSTQAIIASADIVVVLWPDGEIADLTFGKKTRLRAEPDALRNRMVSELAEQPDRLALEKMVEQARNGRATQAIRIRHSPLVGADTTASYSAHLAGDGKNIILIGNLNGGGLQLAERVIDAEITRSRQQATQETEARYQALFKTSREGVLIVDAVSGRIEEANGPAASVLGTNVGSLSGTQLDTHFLEPEIAEQLADVAATPEVSLELTTAAGRACRLVSRMVRTMDRMVLLVRIALTHIEDDDWREPFSQGASQLLQRTWVPIVLTDPGARVLWTNAAFDALVPDRRTVGALVSDLFDLSQHALEIAMREADEHGRLMTSLTALDSETQDLDDVHISVVAVPEEAPVGYGFVMHMPREADADVPSGVAAPDAIEASALAELVGQASMKDLVRRSTSEIEKQCIESALRLTGNNRTEAAEVLGLSRQSFYKKLHEHELL